MSNDLYLPQPKACLPAGRLTGLVESWGLVYYRGIH
jgi:hypothetical protein